MFRARYACYRELIVKLYTVHSISSCDSCNDYLFNMSYLKFDRIAFNLLYRENNLFLIECLIL